MSVFLEYPWKDWNIELKTWLYLPDLTDPPLASRLIRNELHFNIEAINILHLNDGTCHTLYSTL